ncbi:hypothetical protein BGX34_010237 [Mortierella sp. NVP85]|nr:hypothetical protein BGX34_010237 [Mortierella sp. NVP85]
MFRYPIRYSFIRFVISIVSILVSLVVLHHLFAQKSAEYAGPANETSFDPTPAPVKCIPIPVLDRLVCTLVQHIVDSSKTDYGQSVIRDLTAFMGPLVFLLTVEASRLGHSGSLLACIPFTAVVTSLFGVGIYLLIFFVPLTNYFCDGILRTSSASRIPLARVRAILAANAFHMVFIVILTERTMQEDEAHSQALERIIVNAILMVSLWLTYTLLTWLFAGWMGSPQGSSSEVRAAQVADEIKARELVRDSFLFVAAVNVGLQVWAFYRGGSTPLRHIYNYFYRPFPFQDEKYAPAFRLMWDLFGVIGASWLRVLSEMDLLYLVFFILISVLFPGSALMLSAARWENMLIYWHVRSKRVY